MPFAPVPNGFLYIELVSSAPRRPGTIPFV
jgi:hypothetical protein